MLNEPLSYEYVCGLGDIQLRPGRILNEFCGESGGLWIGGRLSWRFPVTGALIDNEDFGLTLSGLVLTVCERSVSQSGV